LAENGIFSESDRQTKPPATLQAQLPRQPLIYKRFIRNTQRRAKSRDQEF
jgi:hypothetical protein